MSVAELQRPRALAVERLQDAAADRTAFGDREFDGMEERATVLRAAVALGADAAEVRAEAGAAAPGHHEADAVVHGLVEREAVRAADERDAVPLQQCEEFGLARSEAPDRVRRVVPVQVRRHVHEHDAVRLVGGRERRVEGSQGGVVQRVRVVAEDDLADHAGRRVERHEPRVGAREREARRAVHAFECLEPGGDVEVVVADDAEVRNRQRVHQTQVVLVALARPGAGEVAEVGEEERRRLELGDLRHERGEDRVSGRVGPRARVAGDDEANRRLRGRSLDALRHRHVPLLGYSRDSTASSWRKILNSDSPETDSVRAAAAIRLLSTYSTTSGEAWLPTIRNRTTSLLPFLTWWAPGAPRRNGTTAPSSSSRSPSGVRSVGRPRRTIRSSSVPWWKWYGPDVAPASSSHTAAPSGSPGMRSSRAPRTPSPKSSSSAFQTFPSNSTIGIVPVGCARMSRWHPFG